MFRHVIVTVALLLALVPVAPAADAYAGSDTLSRELKLMAPLVGRTWVGYYSDDEDREMPHVIEWEPVLGGRSVRESKRVGAVDFEMERIYYWDPEASAVAFLTVTNRGQVSSGTVGTLGDSIELLGHELTEDGLKAFRYTFHVTEEGLLEDRFFRPGEDVWQLRHLVVYEEQAAGEARPNAE